MEEIFKYQFLGNPVTSWLIAIALTIASYLLVLLIKKIVLQKFRLLAKKTRNNIDDTIIDLFQNKTNSFIVLILSLYIGSLAIKTSYNSLLASLAIAAFLIQTAIWLNFLASKIFEKIASDKTGQQTRSAYHGLAIIAKIAIWSIILLLVMNNFGINITALVTGLGIGGVAVALAVQKILGDLFASVSILLDRPFVEGDFIVVDDYAGNVEHIGIKTTRIRSLTGEQIIFSNTDLLGSRIRNYKRMKERRILFNIGATYSTSYEKLEKIPLIIKEIIDRQENARFDRCHFKSFGDSSLEFETVYYVKSADYNAYMDIQQDINIEIFRRFAEEKIEFAYPTRTIYIENGGEK